MSDGPKFCMWCGETLKMRYINNDPENGPAQFRCNDGLHSNLEDEVEIARWKLFSRPPSETLFELMSAMKEEVALAPNHTFAHDQLQHDINQLGSLALRIMSTYAEVQRLDDEHWAQTYGEYMDENLEENK